MQQFIEQWEERIGCRWPFLVALCLTVAYVAEGSL